MTASHKHTIFITFCGSVSGLWGTIPTGDIIRTCLLTATGTIVSFFLTLVLKKLFGRWK
jgi:hypothetical protein